MQRKDEICRKKKQCMDREFVEVLILGRNVLRIMHVDDVVLFFTQKHRIKLKVDGYMKNGGKKNKTDSRLDCYHNRPVKPVLTLRTYLWGFPTMYV